MTRWRDMYLMQVRAASRSSCLLQTRAEQKVLMVGRFCQ